MQKTENLIRFAILFLGFFGVAGVTNAAEYYVATNGSDTNTGAIDSPWQNIAYATCAGSYLCPVQASNPNKLKAGDTLYIRGGTYNQYMIRFTNSGTVGNPITVKSYPGEIAIIDGGFTVATGRNPVFDIDNVNHITIDGLTIDRGSMANVYLAYNYGPTTNIVIQNCDIKNFVYSDNSANIFFGSSGADNILVQNNRLHGVQNLPTGLSNGANIILFHAKTVTIRNNEIYDNYQGIYYKHSSDDRHITTIENNLIYNISGKGLQWSRADGIIRNNVIRDVAGAGINVFGESAVCSALASARNQIVHNTLVDNIVGIVLNRSTLCLGAVDTVLKDNLIYNFTNTWFRGFSVYLECCGVDSSNTTFDHNLIYSSAIASPIRVLTTAYTVTTSPLAGSGNIQSAPIFIDYTGNDLTLALGSEGKNAASDGVDMGARICDVGINTSCAVVSDTASPSAPTGLQVQ